MKVKCNKIISPGTDEDLGEKSSWLTKNKVYIVLAMIIRSDYGIEIYIQSDHNNEPIFFSLNGFEIISQHIPTCWITRQESIHGVVFTNILPKIWDYPDFYSDIEDGDSNAIKIFNEITEQINDEEDNYKPLFDQNA